MSGFHVARWVLDVHGPESEPAEEGSAYRWIENIQIDGEEDARVIGMLPGLMAATAEDLTDLLPDGYTVSIEEDK